MKNRLKRMWRAIAGEAKMIWLWIKNLCFVFLTTKSESRVFVGYGHYWFAKKYADKRTKISMLNKVAGGKRHYVIPVGNYELVVINRLELKYLQSKGVLSNRLNIVKLLENAYYISK